MYFLRPLFYKFESSWRIAEASDRIWTEKVSSVQALTGNEGDPNGFGKCVPHWHACYQYGAWVTEISVLSLCRKQSVKGTEAKARACIKCSGNIKSDVARERKGAGHGKQ